ncbi:Acyl-CoA thioesterase domain-containing protein [Encephalitozoon hellem]|uniref:Acylcoenzyme A thioesterase n=1 Tax=Encephalitozoon hellem TaxID=27973 RepID=A0A9Q9FBJ3_ENCHE|nr:Acyl-CoA thioesterase domain-containing protein [Encephalitozoon hellem ATCC 50504]AFM98373.1 Acyl-CoA thioesterase domain-containing protein [Encephalitozoon hellem ATCC 50504]KAG5859774.1 Acyl-CoA thioesterase domain-containing protein [Encephalitozoon hellem]UTX43255.1 acylcoenzyme A thioesterase [Encephalitozoon hellem]WEL38713.1 acylcoenzyme A thioesterase II [Encephalitozoon hellem]|eukprot:XP_003887354.1 Acyl-CoA thioesterase domain-containing protein [Encephalitozoon hellem ATCC 50504]
MDFFRIVGLGNGIFEGANLWSPFPGYPAFGGQLAAQSLASAFSTVEESSIPVTMSILFTNRCKSDQKVRYNVRNLKDGSIVDMRQVDCYQNDVLISSAHISFSRPDNNTHDYEGTPYEIYDDTFIPFSEYISKSMAASSESQAEVSAKFQILYDNMSMMLNVLDVDVGIGNKDMRQVRIRIKEKQEGIIQKASLLTLISDMFLVETALMASNLTLFSKDLSLLTSLNHVVNFVNLEKDICDGYLYYVVKCKGIRNSKAICEGQLIHEDGTLICLTGQQGVFRVKSSYSKQ